MTTKFASVEDALRMGIYYAGSKQKPADLSAKGEELMSQWGDVTMVKVYEVEGEKGKALLGVGQFRDGYDLWLIDPESGWSQRV